MLVVCNVRKVRDTHAKPTPAMTGNRDIIFLDEKRALKSAADMIIANIGVAARTT